MWKPMVFGAAAVAVATATWMPIRTGRSVQSLSSLPSPVSANFDVEQSTALFVGVSDFTHDPEIAPVPYAVDDAVDLAYMFSMRCASKLVPPRRVVLALSGEPVKEASKRRLEALKNASAVVRTATQSDILALAREQAARAGTDGIFILSLATHGFLLEGVHHILGSDSILRDPETSVSASKLLDDAASTEAARSLVFVDACRERITVGTRGNAPGVVTTAPIVRKMTLVEGQAILYAAPPGQVAYDDPVAGNGVFTKAVIDGLSCNASVRDGIVTAETLRAFVEKRVGDWIRKNRNRDVDAAIQSSVEGDAGRMPLANCGKTQECPRPPVRVSFAGSVVDAFDAEGNRLWRVDVGSRVLDALLTDLDADGVNDVVAGISDGIVALDSKGRRAWSIAEDMALRTFITGAALRQRRDHIIGLWSGGVTIHDGEGSLVGTFKHDGEWQHIALYRPTNHFVPRVVVATADQVFLLYPKHFDKAVWRGVLEPPGETIASLDIADRNGDDQQDILITTNSGKTVAIDVEGRVVGRSSLNFTRKRR